MLLSARSVPVVGAHAHHHLVDIATPSDPMCSGSRSTFSKWVQLHSRNDLHPKSQFHGKHYFGTQCGPIGSAVQPFG